MYTKRIIEKQDRLTKLFSNNINNLKNNKILYLSIFSCACTWSKGFSHSYLKFLSKKNFINFISLFFFFLYEFYSLIKNANFKIKIFISKRNFKKLFLTWGQINSFNNKGIYFDNYFLKNSKKNSNLWFIIGDNELENINKARNCILFYKKNNFFLNLFNLKILSFGFFFSVKKFFHFSNYHSYLAVNLAKYLIDEIKKNKLTEIVMPYEGQIFQDYLIYKVKQNFPKIKVLCFAHSSQPLPLHLIYKNIYIDTLYAHSENQLYHLSKKLLWPAHKLELHKVTKFKRLNLNKFLNKIFLPYGLISIKVILDSLDFLEKRKIINLNQFSVQNHPKAIYSEKHNLLIKRISEIKKNYKRVIKKQKTSILIGATGAVPEALQSVDTVIHILDDLVLESYTSSFWPDIDTVYINDNIVLYSTKNKKKLYKI